MGITYKKMYAVEVETYPEKREIHIVDPDDHGCDTNSVVVVHVDQIDVLIQWLQEAKQEIQNAQTSQESN